MPYRVLTYDSQDVIIERFIRDGLKRKRFHRFGEFRWCYTGQGDIKAQVPTEHLDEFQEMVIKFRTASSMVGTIFNSLGD